MWEVQFNYWAYQNQNTESDKAGLKHLIRDHAFFSPGSVTTCNYFMDVKQEATFLNYYYFFNAAHAVALYALGCGYCVIDSRYCPMCAGCRCSFLSHIIVYSLFSSAVRCMCLSVMQHKISSRSRQVLNNVNGPFGLLQFYLILDWNSVWLCVCLHHSVSSSQCVCVWHILQVFYGTFGFTK